MGQLEGKVVALTGATSGSGLAIAARFVAEGARVMLLARGAERLEATAAELGGGAVPIVCDVGDPDSVREAFGRIGDLAGRLDVLINNAAIYRPCPVDELGDADIASQIATNLAGPIYTARAAIPLLRAAGGGDIVNTSSETTLDPFPMLSIYSATKAGLEMFGRTMAQEVRDDDIRVTTVVQGTAAGPGGGSIGWEWDPEHAQAAMELWTKIGLMNRVSGKYGGQDVEAVADVHVYIVTRPRTQRLDTVFVRSM